MSAGRPPTLWCDLIFAATPLGPARLDHVRVERPLDEEANVAELARLLLEDADELLADPAPLLLGLVDPLEPREEALLGVDVHERHLEVAAEGLGHLLGLVRPHEAVVDEDARQLVADRLVDEQRRDGGVDAARQRAQHALRPDLGADPLDLLLDHRRRRPGRRRAGDPVEEVLQHVLPVRRVPHLGVELDAVQPALRVLERRDRRRRRPRRRRARPSGGAVTESRWLIQTVCSAGSPANSAPSSAPERASCRTRRRRSGRRRRRAPAPSAASRSRSRASGCRARTAPGRPAARPRRRPTPGRPRGSARAGSARAPRPRVSPCGTSSE